MSLPPQMGGSYFQEARRDVSLGLGIALLLAIMFSKNLPLSAVQFIHSSAGRFIAILLVVIMSVSFGILFGILTAIIILLLYTRSNIIEETIKENFYGGGMEKRIVPSKHTWFLEKVMNENPWIIEDEYVRTSSVQDFTNKSSSSYQSSVQNYSVQSM